MGFRFPLFCMLLALSVAGILVAGHSWPALATDSLSLVLNNADCLSYVTAGGTATKPEGTCYSWLKTVLKTDAHCLCKTFRTARSSATLNMTKALALPAACHVFAAATTNCAVSTDIGAAPGLLPIAVSPSSTAGAPSAAGVGLNTGAPTPTPSSLGSYALAVSFELLVFTSVAVIAAYALF